MTFDAAQIRAQFPILCRRPGEQPLHYLDSAATSQIPQTVLDAVITHETTSRANVRRGLHRLADLATEAYENARAAIARYVGAAAVEEIVFTSGTTFAINMVAHSFGATLKAGDEVVLSVAEHHSNIAPWQFLAERSGVVLRFLPVTPEGRVEVAALEENIGPRTRLISITHCSNVTGAITDLTNVVAAARSTNAKVLVDGAQFIPSCRLDMRALGVDFYAFSSHKMYGPGGVGVLWGRSQALAELPPFLGGGGMVRTLDLNRATFADPPWRFEAGTPPIAQAVGLGAAVEWLGGLDWNGAQLHLATLVARALGGMAEIDGLRVLGPAAGDRRTGVISFVLEGVHAHDLAQVLDAHGVAVRGGHHCAQPLMNFFGVDTTTRASFAFYNNIDDVDAMLAGIKDAVGKFR